MTGVHSGPPSPPTANWLPWLVWGLSVLAAAVVHELWVWGEEMNVWWGRGGRGRGENLFLDVVRVCLLMIPVLVLTVEVEIGLKTRCRYQAGKEKGYIW